MKILISGATKGFGEACTIAFLKRGDSVFGFSRSQANVDEALLRIQNEVPEAVAENRIKLVAGDIATVARSLELIEDARTFMGGIDMLVNNIGVFKFDDDMMEVANEDNHLSMSLESFRQKHGTDAKRELYRLLMQTNLYGNARFVELLVKQATEGSHTFIIADVGSIGAIDQMSTKKFGGTVHYNRSKALLIEHTIELARKNPLLKIRAIHPGPFGDSAQAIADKFGDTWAIKDVADVATHAVKLFTEDTDEQITHGIFASEKHFCWQPEYFGDIEALGIKGLTWARSLKVPEEKSVHLFKKMVAVA